MKKKKENNRIETVDLVGHRLKKEKREKEKATDGRVEAAEVARLAGLVRVVEPVDADLHGAAPRLPQQLDAADVRPVRPALRRQEDAAVAHLRTPSRPIDHRLV